MFTTTSQACQDGILSDISGSITSRVCCHKACGVCGGSDCASRPGGANVCCEDNVRKSGRVCDQDAPPCVTANARTESSIFMSSCTNQLAAAHRGGRGEGGTG